MYRKQGMAVLILLLCLGISMPVLSQQLDEPCKDVFIDDSGSKVKLNREAICDAAKPWTEYFDVYVFLTDEVPRSEDHWFSITDAFEERANIYYPDLPADRNFSLTAISFEASTMPRNIYAANITISNPLWETPLGNDNTRALLKGQLRNNLEDGDYTTAFVTVISNSYNTAFPAVAPVQPVVVVPTQQVVATAVATRSLPATTVAATSVPLRTSVPMATGVPQIQTPPVIQTNSETSSPIGTVILFLVLLIGGGVGGTYVIKFTEQRRQNARYLQQIVDIKQRISRLLNIGQNLLGGNSASETQLYDVWSANGGENYPPMNTKVLRLITSARNAFNLAHIRHKELDASVSLPLVEQLRGWETVYITLVGTTEEVQSMDEQQLQDLLNPLTVVEKEDVGDALYQQLTDNFPTDDADHKDALRLDLLLVNKDEVQTDGILGSVGLVKDELRTLKQAKTKGPDAHTAADYAINNLVLHHEFPADLPANLALGYPIVLLAQSAKAVQEQRWMDVMELAEKAKHAATEQVLPLVQQYVTAKELSVTATQGIAALQKAGYNLRVLQPDLTAISDDIKIFKQALTDGEYAKAEEFVAEIAHDSEHALMSATALQTLHDKNVASLADLANNVAEAKKIFGTEISGDFAELTEEYPPSNWGEAKAAYDAAQQIIEALTDNPQDTKDIVSRITELNSLEKGEFETAETQLSDASAQLTQARQHFTTISDQLTLVQRTELEVSDALSSAESEIKKAVTTRDTSNEMVTPEVDAALNTASETLAQARQMADKREFVSALASAQQARTLAVSALTTANDQIKAIQEQLRVIPEWTLQAKTRIAEASQALRNLLPSLQTSSMEQDLVSANKSLADANSVGAGTSGKQDIAWLNALTIQRHQYDNAVEYAEQVIDAVKDANRKYRSIIAATEQAINDANSALQDADRLSAHSDARDAGQNAVMRARSTLPSLPTYGMTLDALLRSQQQAEQAATYARQASQAAQAAINQAEAERQRLRQIQLQLEQQRNEQQREEQRQPDERDQEARRERMKRTTTPPMGGSGGSFGGRSNNSNQGARASNNSLGGRKR